MKWRENNLIAREIRVTGPRNTDSVYASVANCKNQTSKTRPSLGSATFVFNILLRPVFIDLPRAPAMSLGDAAYAAECNGFTFTGKNEKSRVAFFEREGVNGTEKIDLYYTTNTVKTLLIQNRGKRSCSAATPTSRRSLKTHDSTPGLATTNDRGPILLGNMHRIRCCLHII
jgi:hypothetical protein